MASALSFGAHVIVLLLAVATASTDPQKLLNDVCRLSGIYDFCVQALESDPKTATTSSVLGLTRIALNLAIQNTTSSRVYVGDLVGKSEGSTKRALKMCVRSYEWGIESLEDALQVLEDQDEGQHEDDNLDALVANFDVSDAMDYFMQCEKAFKDANVSVSSLSQTWVNFCKIGGVLTHMLRE